MRLKRRDLIIIVVLIAICLVTLVGSSYALFTRTFTSNKKISVQAGTLKVDFAEGNRINLSNVAPMSDSDAMNTTPYTFTITNNGSVAAYYTIRNEEDISNTLNNKYIKYRLISDNYDSGIKTLDYLLSSENTLAVGESVTYKLYLWLSSESDNDAQNKTYQSKIVVQSTTNSISDTVATTLLKGVGDNGSIDASDPEQTFITGTDPNNYIWYSGKLWRAVSIDPTDNSVKLVTQWNITLLVYNVNQVVSYANSYVREWLNDTSVDGFLGNLREPEKFIKTDSIWYTSSDKLNKFNDSVGILNLYEYKMINKEKNDYLYNGLYWWLLTPCDNGTTVKSISYYGEEICHNTTNGFGIRPAINLKANIKIVAGTGTVDDPYRLEGDYDNYLSGTLLSKRYSGEYIKFGTGDNELYRIVSHENGDTTKIVSAFPLKADSNYKTISYSTTDNELFSKDESVGKFLNDDFLVDNVYLSTSSNSMIAENSVWYLGSVGSGGHYRLAKYQDASSLTSNSIISKVGLLRYGELMSGQFDIYSNNTYYWTLTPMAKNAMRVIDYNGDDNIYSPSKEYGIKPAMNLKSNVVITGGDGTKSSPFSVALQ